MKCTIPEISWHNRDPVLSVDVQANTKNESFQRLATGGTDAHVVIWYLEIQETGAASVEFAADLQRHQKAVNVVRFSPSGEFLASGDDESVIIIWKQKTDQDLPEMPTTDSEGNKEQWVVLKVLRGHMEDVYDLCWSPDSLNLISGSVDNSAILWDAQKGRNLGILRDHKGFVQGVAWDPLNKYVATLSSDRTCRVYSLKSKKIVSRMTKAQLPVPDSSELHGKVVRLFHDDTLKSFFRRLCFSPDGQLLITPSGIVENADSDKHGNATHIFTRRVLNRPSAFLPSNNQYTVAVRCCPVLFELRSRDCVFALPYRIVLAVATQKSILLYDTQQPEPFGIVSNIHYTRLTDMTWSQDGRMLIVSSTDGYCSIITFAVGELGQPYKCKENVSAEAKEKDSVTCAPESKTQALQSTNLPQNCETGKSEKQEKTPEKVKELGKVDSPVTPNDRQMVVLSETPGQIKPVSAANSPSTLTNSPLQKTPKRIKPILISKLTNSSPKSSGQSLKKPEATSATKGSTESTESCEHKKEAAEVKPAAEKMEAESAFPQSTVNTAVESPSRTEIKPKQEKRTPRRVQLITLSTGKASTESKQAAEKNKDLPSSSSTKEATVQETMAVDSSPAQEKQPEESKSSSRQDAETERMETDEPVGAAEVETNKEETTQRRKGSQQKETLEEGSEGKGSFSESKECVLNKKDESVQGNSTPSHRTTATSLTPSDTSMTPHSPLRNEVRPTSATPGQEKRTPRRVQLITLSSPKSKKKLL